MRVNRFNTIVRRILSSLSRVSFTCLIAHFDVSLIQSLLLYRRRSTEAECNELNAMMNAVLFLILRVPWSM